MQPHEYEQKLQNYLDQQGLSARLLPFAQSCHSVAEAVAALAGVGISASAEDFVKSICLIDEKGRLVVAIVKGEDRVSRGRVAEALGQGLPRLAHADEILERTGFPCGGTPAFGYPAVVLIDPRVLERQQVYTGGGSETALLQVAVSELVQASQGQVVRVRK